MPGFRADRTSDRPQSARAQPGRFWPVVIALLAAEVTGSFEMAMIYAAQRALNEELGDPIRVGWLITSYLIVGAGSAALAGRLGDLFGRRRVLLLILALGTAGSLVSAFSPDYTLLLAGRCIQGATGAILPLSIGLARENLPPHRVPMGIGLMISGASAGAAAGLVLGGVIVDGYAWHGIFLASAGFGVVAAIAVFALVPPSIERVPGRIDWLGGALFVPAVFAILIAITYGATWGLFDVRTLGLAGAGVALLAAWVRVSLTTPQPLFEVRLLANRQVAIANAVAALLSMSAIQITLVFSLMLQAPRWTVIGLGASATLAGLVKLPSNVGSLFAGPLGGWMTARRGGRAAMLAGGAICVSGWLLALAFHGSIEVIGAILIVISFGTTMLAAVGPTIVAAAVPPGRTSEAAGLTSVLRQAFMGIGAQMVSVILASDTMTQGGGGRGYPTEAAFMLTIGVIATLCAAATLLCLALPRDAGRDPASGRRPTPSGPEIAGARPR